MLFRSLKTAAQSAAQKVRAPSAQAESTNNLSASSPSNATPSVASQAESSPKVEKLLSEISEVKNLLQSHVAGSFWGNIQQGNAQITEVVKHLLNSGFSPKLCTEIARSLPEDLSLPALIKQAREQVKCMIKTSHPFDIFDRGGVFAFIGPTGVEIGRAHV